MKLDRIRIILSISLWFLLTLIILCLGIFPIIVSPLFSDILFISLNIIFFLVVFRVALNVETEKNLLFLAPQTMIYAFIIRALPNIRLTYPPLHDPYFYYVSALNIFGHGSLDPALSSWYQQVGIQLNWPAMQLDTFSISSITTIDPMFLFRFQEPLLGIVFFLGVYILARAVTNSPSTSFIAALLASFSELIVYYQSEYHPQGFAFILFVFLLYGLIRVRLPNGWAMSIILLIFIMAFTISHHFSSIFLGILGVAYILLTLMEIKLLKFNKLRMDINIWFLIAVTCVAYHFLGYSDIIKDFIKKATTISPPGDPILTSGQAPLLYTALSFGKWSIFCVALAVISWLYISKILRNKKVESHYDLSLLRLAGILICTLVAGFIGSFVFFSPTNRIMAFSMPLLAIFASIGFMKALHYKYNKKFYMRPMVLVIIIFSIISGIISAQFTTSYVLHSEGPDGYYWYSNILPSMDQYASLGNWISPHAPQNATFDTEFETRVVPFFFGNRPLSDVIYPADGSGDFLLLGVKPHGSPEIMYGWERENIYSNGEAVMMIQVK